MNDELQKGRDLYRRRAWRDAFAALDRADRAAPLGAEDLERLAVSAYLAGRDLDFQRYLERAHQSYLAGDDRPRAARAAFWVGLGLFLRGEPAQASGWLARARRLVEGRDCVEQGYLLLPAAEQQLGGSAVVAAYETATAAADIGARFGDADLVASARHLQGRALIRRSEVRSGLELLDEAMLAVVSGELSPIMTGLIYCSVIEACRQVYASSRAREWTAALARWCEEQPQMVAFRGICLVHRAEILQLSGAWPEALAEARRACESASREAEREPPAAAFYQRAELHRLRGELAAAEEAYRNAARRGCDPQPGLALLRMAEGRTRAARAAIRRALDATAPPLERTRLLPAFAEIATAAGAIEEARDACRELEEIAAAFDTDVLRALAAQARGEVELAGGDARAALGPLRRAFECWSRVEAPYEAARVRVLIGTTCLSLGDEETAELELGAAHAVFEILGAAPDLARLRSIRERGTVRPRHPLTTRELEVLRRIAAGKTNKSIAAELSLSERTIDRHVSNIFNKLDVSSRAAAIAYAYDHELL